MVECLVDAEAGPDQTVCANKDAFFDGSGSTDPDGDVVIYTWEFGDGTAAPGNPVTHQYAVIDSYSVTLTISDGILSDTDNSEVTVIDCTSSVSGMVTLKYPGYVSPTVDIMYQLRPTGLPPTRPVYEGTHALSITPGIPAFGVFTIPGVSDGTYDIALKTANRVAGMAQNVTVAGDNLTWPNISLWPGDGGGDDSPVNTYEIGDDVGDNDVDWFDSRTFYHQYRGDLPVTAGKNSDYDGDGVIGIPDYNGIRYTYVNNPDPGNWFYAPGPITDGLVAHWTFDETSGQTAHDSSPNEFHGTVVGAQRVPGISGGALDFPASGAVYIPAESTPPPVEIGNLQYGTITIWFQYREFSGQNVVPLLCFGRSQPGTYHNSLIIEIGHAGDNRRLYFTILHARLCFDSGFDLEPDTWYHFAAVVGPTGNTGYLNGLEMVDRNYNLGSNSSYTDFFPSVAIQELMAVSYGRYGQADPFYHHDGTIDEIRIYGRPLEASEIVEIYNERSP